MTDYISKRGLWVRNIAGTVVLLALVGVWIQGLITLSPLVWDHVIGAIIGLLLIGAMKWA